LVSSATTKLSIDVMHVFSFCVCVDANDNELAF
jgi:hypothetical protein